MKTNADLESKVRQFALHLKHEFASKIEQTPAVFKKQVLKIIRRELPPKRGRPNDPRIDAALQMVSEGKSLKAVLRLQISNFERMDTYSRYLAEKGLRTAIARRQRRLIPTS